MATLVTLRTDATNRIADSTGKFWSATMLNSWINSALKDVARRAEILESIKTIAVTGGLGTRSYALALDIFRIHRVEFEVTAGTNVYTLEPRDIHEMDSVWGRNQAQAQAYPSYYTVWGIMGIDAKIYIYPTASQNGTLNVWCYRLPAVVSADADVCEIPTGWEDLIPLYCEYIALRRDNDPRWQDAKSIYEQELSDCINLTRSHHDQAHWITTSPVNQPAWMNGGDW